MMLFWFWWNRYLNMLSKLFTIIFLGTQNITLVYSLILLSYSKLAINKILTVLTIFLKIGNWFNRYDFYITC